MQLEVQRADHVRRAIASIPAGLQGYFDSLAAILEQAMASGAGF